MKTNRRQFITTSLAGGIAAAVPGFNITQENLKDKYARLDKILMEPVFKSNLFTSPVIIDNTGTSEVQE